MGLELYLNVHVPVGVLSLSSTASVVFKKLLELDDLRR